jgi:hypothetical protein
VLRRGTLVVCLVAVWGGSKVGCYRPTVLPPRASMAPRTPSASPTVSPQVASPQPMAVPSLPTITVPAQPQAPAFPPSLTASWKPNAAARDWKHIVIHHTASNRGSVASIHESHLQRKDGSGKPWKGIGYHFVVGNGHGMGDGEVEPTFRWREQTAGAHAGTAEYNQSGIGIAVVGNFDEEPPTAAQLNAVKQLVGELKSEYGIPAENVIGHGEIKATACPGKYFPLAEVSRSRFDPSFSRRTLSQAPVNTVSHVGSRRK